MNLPNKLTIFRVLLIPIYVIFMEINIFGGADKYIAVTIFIIASLTDLIDGKIARRYNLVTNFGKFMDPLADKLLVCSALICLIGQIPEWVVIVIIARDFIISGFRLVASDEGRVIAAGWSGKVKTTVQMIMVIWLMFDIQWSPVKDIYYVIGQVLVYIALILTIYSLIDCMHKNKDILKMN